MITRRNLLRAAAGAAGAVAVGGCVHRTTAAPRPADLVYAGTDRGLVTVDMRTGLVSVVGGATVASPDWTRLAISTVDSGHTRIVLRDTATGQVIARAAVPGALTPRAVAPDGRLALATASGEPSGTGPADGNPEADTGIYRPTGRDSTTISVVYTGGERSWTTLPGCVEPEAFSTSGQVLYVLDYLPPRQPDRYRVRAVDLADGTVKPLLTQFKQLVPEAAEEEMRGIGRQAVYAASSGLLYTLYTHQPDHTHTRELTGAAARVQRHAFVHTLSLPGGWAYCIDLPEPFGEAAATGHAIALSADGRQLFVVDAAGGRLATVDPHGLRVTNVAAVEPTPDATAALTVTTTHVLLAAGPAVTVVDRYSLAVTGRWPLDSAARGIARNAAGTYVYIGQAGAVQARTADGGRLTWQVPVAGLTAVRHAAGPKAA